MAASLSAIPGLPMRATPELHQDGVLPSLTYFLGLLVECWWDRVDVLVTHMVGSTFLPAWPWDCLISIVSGKLWYLSYITCRLWVPVSVSQSINSESHL